MNKKKPGNGDSSKTGNNSIQPNEHGSYIDNEKERSLLWVLKGKEPRNEFERQLKKEIDEMPEGAIVDIPFDI
jgi:hypothetical protein